jgi:hypothetical protein
MGTGGAARPTEYPQAASPLPVAPGDSNNVTVERAVESSMVNPYLDHAELTQHIAVQLLIETLASSV